MEISFLIDLGQPKKYIFGERLYVTVPVSEFTDTCHLLFLACFTGLYRLCGGLIRDNRPVWSYAKGE